MIALLRDEPAADDVAVLLEQPTAMSAANYAEVIDHLVRLAAIDADEAEIRMQLLVEAGMRVVAVDTRLAGRAGEIRGRRYARRSCEISLADCCALATSLSLDAALATSDPALAAAARAEGCGVVALPDSRGVRP